MNSKELQWNHSWLFSLLIVCLLGCHQKISDSQQKDFPCNAVMQDESFLHFIQTQDFNVILPSSSYTKKRIGRFKIN